VVAASPELGSARTAGVCDGQDALALGGVGGENAMELASDRSQIGHAALLIGDTCKESRQIASLPSACRVLVAGYLAGACFTPRQAPAHIHDLDHSPTPSTVS